MTGRVVERKADVGTSVGQEGDPLELYTVADLSAVWIELTVTPSDLGKIKEGDKARISMSGDAERQAEAQIMFVSPFLNQDTRSARVIAALDNKDFSWRPGSFVTAEIEIQREQVPVLAPRIALQTIGGERVAFLRTPTGFLRRNVKVGAEDHDPLKLYRACPTATRSPLRTHF